MTEVLIRPPWHEYFMELAHVVAKRATCPRKHVGAVIVCRRHVIATGYNGAVMGAPHCEDIGCLIEDNHCVRTVHAEVNAIAQAAKVGTPINGSTIYTTAFPCFPCGKVLANAGIKSVIYAEAYRMDQRVADMFRDLGVKLQWIKVDA